MLFLTTALSQMIALGQVDPHWLFPSWLNSSPHPIPPALLGSAQDLLTGDREPRPRGRGTMAPLCQCSVSFLRLLCWVRTQPSAQVSQPGRWLPGVCLPLWSWPEMMEQESFNVMLVLHITLLQPKRSQCGIVPWFLQIVLIDSWFGRTAVVCSSALTLSGLASLAKALKHQAAKLSHCSTITTCYSFKVSLHWSRFLLVCAAEPLPASWERDPETDRFCGSAGRQSGGRVSAGRTSTVSLWEPICPLDQESRGWVWGCGFVLICTDHQSVYRCSWPSSGCLLFFFGRRRSLLIPEWKNLHNYSCKKCVQKDWKDQVLYIFYFGKHWLFEYFLWKLQVRQSLIFIRIAEQVPLGILVCSRSSWLNTAGLLRPWSTLIRFYLLLSLV